MAGERSLSSIKKFKSDNGGKHIENTLSKKYSAWEEERTTFAYKNNHINLSTNTNKIFHRPINNNNFKINLLKELDDFDKYLIITNDQNEQEIKFCDYLFTMKEKINIKDITNKNYYTDFYKDDFFQNRDNNYNNIKNNNKKMNFINNFSIFNLYEINELLMSLKDECVRICNLTKDKIIEPLAVSSLCRLFSCYMVERRRYMKLFSIKIEPSFYVWIYSFINTVNEYVPDPKNITKYLKIEKDYITCLEILDLHKTILQNIYSEANIYGKTFKSRGIEYKENSLSLEETGIFDNFNVCNNQLNVLNYINTFDSKSVSSWFKCNIPIDESNIEKNKDFYGQFNFFFIIPKFEFDPLISGLHYSSVVFRNYKTNNSIDTIMIKSSI